MFTLHLAIYLFNFMMFWQTFTSLSLLYTYAAPAAGDDLPVPPLPEPIAITELPLPPLAPNNDTGSCTKDLNPLGTGCLANGISGAFQSGDFLPDGKHVIAQVTYQGAPASPDPASVYNGLQIIIVKTDGTNFTHGDPWKCVTCGVPDENAQGVYLQYDYPQAFRDGKRLLIGKNVLDCGDSDLTSDECTPDKTHIYPLRWSTAADDSGAGSDFRELRLHPDQAHIQFNAFTTTALGLGQYGYFARIAFNPSPTTGTPLAPRYDLVNITRLHNSSLPKTLTFSGDKLTFDPNALYIGEVRGFSGDGSEITYVGYSTESCNIDVFAAHLTTGAVRRLTSHPEYCDPLSFSQDNKWMAIMDTRGSGRQMFIAGMRGIPPIVDLIANVLPASVRNNGPRRFFQPYLLDWYGDRGDYYGQKINGDGYGVAGSGSVDDPEWNGMADPRWSPDSTQLVYWQTHTISPSCGGDNPLPCYNSTEPYGRNYRMYLATFTSREPTTPLEVPEHSDVIPWGESYVPGSASPPLILPEAGEYTLAGKCAGVAQVNVTWLTAPQVGSISVIYDNYSDDGLSFLNGNENVTLTVPSVYSSHFDWYSDILQTGAVNGSKKTSVDGYHASIDVLVNVLESNGTLTTTLDGVEWTSPPSGT